MADPRISTPFERKEVLSPLMRAKANAINGETVNRCPFGCAIEALDDNGYCKHLVGFSVDGKTYEPMIIDPKTGRRIVRVPMKQGKDGTMVPDLPLVQNGDQLDRITSSSRVYRPYIPSPAEVHPPDAREEEAQEQAGETPVGVGASEQPAEKASRKRSA